MYKAYKFRLYPDKEQQTKINIETLPKCLIENPKYAIGIKSLVTLSDCTFISNNHYIKSLRKE